MPVATDLLPTPVGTPPPQAASLLISDDINIATRKQHTELNRLIIDRLPLALPPNASSPERYVIGISAFAPIYAAFEAAHTDLSAFGKPVNAKYPRALEQWQELSLLIPEGLARTQYLERDKATSHRRPGRTYRYKDQEIWRRVHDLCTRKPHVLIAYTWVMYMAIFSGGRWIRQQLANAGPEFWNGSSAKDKSTGFDFLSFPDSDEDGEDIKRQYKARLASVHSLTKKERQDVLDAAVDLFEMCIHLVHCVDMEIARQEKTWRIFPCHDSTVPRAISMIIAAVALLCLWKIGMPNLQILDG